MNDVYYYKRSCKGKQNHRDPVWALIACSEAYRKYGANMFVYKCQFCVCWHVGHTHKIVREFVRLLVGGDSKFTFGGVTVRPMQLRKSA